MGKLSQRNTVEYIEGLWAVFYWTYIYKPKGNLILSGATDARTSPKLKGK